jgi:hypothetical protein
MKTAAKSTRSTRSVKTEEVVAPAPVKAKGTGKKGGHAAEVVFDDMEEEEDGVIGSKKRSRPTSAASASSTAPTKHNNTEHTKIQEKTQESGSNGDDNTINSSSVSGVDSVEAVEELESHHNNRRSSKVRANNNLSVVGEVPVDMISSSKKANVVPVKAQARSPAVVEIDLVEGDIASNPSKKKAKNSIGLTSKSQDTIVTIDLVGSSVVMSKKSEAVGRQLQHHQDPAVITQATPSPSPGTVAVTTQLENVVINKEPAASNSRSHVDTSTFSSVIKAAPSKMQLGNNVIFNSHVSTKQKLASLSLCSTECGLDGDRICVSKDGTFACVLDGGVREAGLSEFVHDRVCLYYDEVLNKYKQTSGLYAEDMEHVLVRVRQRLLHDARYNKLECLAAGVDFCGVCLHADTVQSSNAKKCPSHYVAGNAGTTQAYLSRNGVAVCLAAPTCLASGGFSLSSE